jgi:hypothetical protein
VPHSDKVEELKAKLAAMRAKTQEQVSLLQMEAMAYRQLERSADDEIEALKK